MKRLLIAGIILSFGLSNLGLSKDPNAIVVDGSTTVGPIAKAFAEAHMKEHKAVSITVSESGSGNGAKSLIGATCDIATMSRPMKNSEIKAAKDAGVLPIEHVVAMDGIVVVLHPSNPVSGLSLKQIRDIYTGKVTSWSQVGGPNEGILPISRDTNSGTYEAFETLVLKGQKISGRAEYVGSNGGVRQRVLSTPTAIGYVGLAFTEGLKSLKVDGIEPTANTVKDGTYPISRPLFMYTNGRPDTGSPLEGFIGLSGTQQGKEIISSIGYVPVD